jgi:hypothetical protein
VRPHAGGEHSVPPVHRLRPEGIEKTDRLDSLVTAPRIVDQEVDPSLLAPYLFEDRLDFGVHGGVRADRDPDAAPLGYQFGRTLDGQLGKIRSGRRAADAAPGHVHGGTRLAECERDAASSASARPGNHGDLAAQHPIAALVVEFLHAVPPLEFPG